VRIYHLARLLEQIADVTILVLHGSQSPQDVNATRAAFQRVEVIHLPPRPRRRGPAHQANRVRSFYQRIYGVRSDAAAQTMFRRLRAKNDLVWFETLATALFFGGGPFAASIADLDDIMHVKFSQEAGLMPWSLKKMALLGLATAHRRREFALTRRFTVVGVTSEDDRAYLHGDSRFHVIPNGYAGPPEPPTWLPKQDARIGFIGHLGYYPNQDALRWFIATIWPQILAQCPGATLRIVGRLPAQNEFATGPRVEPLGFVDDAAAEMATWSAMVVPLRLGGGTRIKIIEAFSRRIPVISTRLGAYGLSATPEKHFLAADTPEDFAEHCLRMLTDDSFGEKMTGAARAFYEQHYTWDLIGRSVAMAVEDCLRRSETEVS